jgi:hypothetical protein
MRQRGRRSAASLSVVATTEAPRPAPPRPLSREAKAVWRATTARFRPDHFVGAEPVLEAYAEGVVMLRNLVERIKETNASEPVDYKRLAALMQLQKAQALLIGNLGGKLRLTPRARFDRYSVRPLPNVVKPWDLGRSSHPFDDERHPRPHEK